MAKLIGIDPDYDHLYDPQQARPAGECPICGAEIWGIDHNLCVRCEERSEDNEIQNL